MPIDLENLNPGIWFDYPEDGAEECVCIRSLNQAALKEINIATEKKQVAFKQPTDEKGKINRRIPPQRVEWVEVTDPQVRDEMIWDYTVVDWKLLDMSNDPVPCTKENKNKLMHESGSFMFFWAECLERIDEIEKEHEKTLEKNA